MPGLNINLNTIVTQLAVTATYVVLVLFARALLARRVRAQNSSEVKRKNLVQIRNLAFLAVIVGLTIIWSSQLRGMALSVMAIIVAIVIASKELIMCLSGSFVRLGSDAFEVGDRIEILGMRGDVIDHSLLSTKLLEIGPGQLAHQATGRSITLPNSVFLSNTVINESLTRKYVLHAFSVPFKRTDPWREAEHRLLHAAIEESCDYIEDARREVSELGRQEGLETPSVDPRVTLHFPDDERVDLLVRLAVPTRRKGSIQQAILRAAILNGSDLGAPATGSS